MKIFQSLVTKPKKVLGQKTDENRYDTVETSYTRKTTKKL